MPVGYAIISGDSLQELQGLATASIDAVVTDPPYSLGFMGNSWDKHDGPAAYAAWCNSWATECCRVLKPGGHLLAFGGTRTSHRLACGVEDAGFEIRDTITWHYASGFPKSHDVSKAIDKVAGVIREVIETRRTQPKFARAGDGRLQPKWVDKNTVDVTAPATDAARKWEGWGTALKPASEPIIVARKPLAGTVAQTVLAHGTGVLNIGRCRVEAEDAPEGRLRHGGGSAVSGSMSGPLNPDVRPPSPAGRWPSNVVWSHAATLEGEDLCADGCVEGCPVAELDRQSGALTSGYMRPETNRATRQGAAYGAFFARTATATYGDSGGASRFFPTFRYQAKAPARERPKVDGVAHPTVKPLALMRWLVRLACPPGGVVLDPFVGSGTTIEACLLEGVDCVAIERELAYLPLIDARLDRVDG